MSNEHIVTAEDGGVRLDRWLKRHFPQIKHGLMEKLLRMGDIRVEGKKIKSSHRLEMGNTVKVRVPKTMPVAEEPTAKSSHQTVVSEHDIRMMQEAVLFKNNDVIVINKPSGLAVQGGSKIDKSVDGLLNALRFDAKERPKLVHRLDKDTSGVLVLARSAKAASHLMPLFAGKKVEKTYWALVKGAPEISEGKIDLPLAKQEEGSVDKVEIDEKDGKSAITIYRVLERLSKTMAWVELMPITGRMHQLRVHMAAIGHPILGDGKYGGREAFIDGMELSKKLHLHAQRIVIPGMLDVRAPLPKHMRESFKTLGLEE